MSKGKERERERERESLRERERESVCVCVCFESGTVSRANGALLCQSVMWSVAC